MPAITRVKDLYMAKSVGELNNQANDKTTIIIKSSAPNLVINSIEKVFYQAESEYNCGDEEKAYIFYMRAASLYQAVKSPRLKEDKKYGKMFQEAVNKCEGLARNLEKRYSEAYKPNTPSSTTATTTTSLPMPGKTVKAINSKNLSNNSNNNSPKSAVNNDHNNLNNNNGFKDDLSYVNNRRDDCNITQVDGDITTPTIEPTELFELIEDLQKNRPQDVILLLDARRKEDFDASHISNLKTDRAKLLNIPEKLLVKGTAATKLMKMLPENAQTILKERRTARKVIIFDWKSTSHNENEHLDALYAALWKFDPKDGCQSPPILLKTGYYGWLASYPTFTSNPKVTPPPSADDSSNVSDYDSASINYYTRLIKSEDSSSDSSSTPEKPKTLLNGSSHQSESSDDVVSHDVDMGTVQDSNELVARLTNSKLKDNANKIPGSAQPVPTVNRQVKPKLSKNELNVATVSPFNNKISRNDKPNGLTQPPTNHPTNGSIYENNNNIIERELKARRALEAQEEINKLMESDYEKGHREKDEMLKKMEAHRENLLRENVDLKRRLKPNPSSFNSLNSSSSPSSLSTTSSSSSTNATGTTMSPVLSREPLKPPVRFNMIGENGDSDEDESENEREMVSKDSDEEMCSPLHRPKLETKLNTPKASSKRSDERTVSESSSSLISTPRPPSSISKTGKSLPRSYSSPNIADHYDDDDSQNRPPTHHHHPPTFDRALKPLNNGTEGFPRSFTSSTRMRNFSPIYGIPGQVNTGLKNLGNTCFMNAVLQCLADTSIFRRYFLQEKHMADISRNSRLGSKGELADELGALIREIRSNQYKSVSPSHFKDAVGTHMPFFMGCEQQDAHEFLCMLLEKLHADLNKAPQANVSNGIFTLPDDLPPNIAINKFWTHHLSRNRSIVSDLFEGLLMSTLKCTACGKQSHSFEVFTNLSLPIPTKLGHRITILDCLDLFSDEEKLFGEAAWECPTCKTKRDAIKQIKICKLPNVLVIHLKRFSYEGKWRQKLQNMVDFPLFDLKLKRYRSCNSLDPVGFDASYDLYGVVNHYGTLEGGHYVAYCKNDEKNKWFKYDDHEVTELSAADVKSHAAYLLFYTSRN